MKLEHSLKGLARFIKRVSQKCYEMNMLMKLSGKVYVYQSINKRNFEHFTSKDCISSKRCNAAI